MNLDANQLEDDILEKNQKSIVTGTFAKLLLVFEYDNVIQTMQLTSWTQVTNDFDSQTYDYSDGDISKVEDARLFHFNWHMRGVLGRVLVILAFPS